MRTKKKSVSARIQRAAIETLETRQLLSAEAPFFAGPMGTNMLIPPAAYDQGGEGVAFHDTTPTNLGTDQTYRGDAVDINTGGATGHVITHTDVGEWFKYTLTIPVAGQYQLVASVSNTATGALFHPEFNGVYTTGPIAVPNTGSFNTYQGVATTYNANLKAGPCVMRIYIDAVASNGAGGNFQGFNLVPVPLPGSTTEAPYSTPYTTGQVIPFAKFDKGGEGVGYHDTTPSNLSNDPLRQPGGADITYGGSTGDFVAYTVPGEWMAYTLNIQTAGKYVIKANIANPASGAVFHASENGVSLTGSTAITATSSFTTFGTVTSAPFSLSAGSQIMKIVFDKAATNGAVGNFDTFTIVPFVSSLEVPFTTPFATNAAIPAVNYDKGGEGIGYHDTTTANLGNSSFRAGDGVDISTGGTSGNYVGFTAVGEYLNYTLNVATAGMYTLQANAANTAAGAQFHAAFGGLNLSGEVTVGATASYTTFAINKSTPFSLAAGQQIMSIYFDKAASNGAIGNYDYFKLVPYTPPTESPFTTAFAPNTTIPAANFNNGGEGVAYHDTTTANLGNDNYRAGESVDLQTGGTTGHVVAFTAVGEYLDYTVNVNATGNYKLQASVANPAAGASFHVSVNGTNVSGPITIAQTAGFTTYATNTSNSFALTQGTVVLRIFLDKAATNGAVGNFDWFKLVPVTG